MAMHHAPRKRDILNGRFRPRTDCDLLASNHNQRRIAMSQAAVREVARAPAHDRSTVEAVIKLYLDGLYESDADKLAAAFHPTADLRWQDKGEFHVLTREDWLDRVRKRPSAKSQGQQRHDFVVMVDRSDESTVFVKVKCALPPRFFTDYLVLLKLNDGWQVVSKAYRYEMRE
jgi:hypothetical protein